MANGRPTDIVVRFFARISPEPNSGCWLWTGDIVYTRRGYGKLIVQKGASPKNRKFYAAHRLSYEIHHGAIPDGLYVCHRCDVPCCVNPDHLFLGTPKDNQQDCIKKGRHGNQGKGSLKCRGCGKMKTGANAYQHPREVATRCRNCRSRYRDNDRAKRYAKRRHWLESPEAKTASKFRFINPPNRKYPPWWTGDGEGN